MRAGDAAATPAPADTADILALLDQEKPDPAKAAKLAADADAAIPPNLTAPKRGDAYFNRARARALVGRINEAIADAQEAVKLSKGENYDRVTSRYEQFLHRRLLEVGDSKHAVPIMMGEIRNFQGRQPGRLFSLYDELAIIYLLADNVDETERLAGTLHSLLAASRTWSAGYDPFRAIFQAEVDRIDAHLRESRNQFVEAEAIYHHAGDAMRAALDRYDEAVKIEGKNFAFRDDLERPVDEFQISQGLMKIQQGRAVEAEVDIRGALLRRLQRLGKYHEETGLAVSRLALAMMAQGRYDDADRLTRAALDIYRTVGFREDTPRFVFNLQQLAQILDARNLPDQAQAIYDRIDRLVANWEPTRREAAVNETPRIKLLIGTGKTAEAVQLATKKLERERARSGDNSPSTAVVRGYLASALAKAGRDAEALAAFRAAVPTLLETSRQEDQ